MSSYKVLDVVMVTVKKINNYGIYVSLEDGYNGFIHISEISDKFVVNINEFIKLNEKIYAEVIDVNEKTKNLNLSIKNINYKITKSYNKIKETPHGFNTLRSKLPYWIKENLKK